MFSYPVYAIDIPSRLLSPLPMPQCSCAFSWIFHASNSFCIFFLFFPVESCTSLSPSRKTDVLQIHKPRFRTRSRIHITPFRRLRVPCYISFTFSKNNSMSPVINLTFSFGPCLHWSMQALPIPSFNNRNHLDPPIPWLRFVYSVPPSRPMQQKSPS